ncbi:phage portal protein [Paraflavitalea pollutisoli]|uniref:phage portal protein n=1 Tax=Paraflavitalea pollutisoli TaxID=3034143 RepID=UPI0023EDAFF1|nr:phage portal protein [Paraflavitalea sp. H1-2-19X]
MNKAQKWIAENILGLKDIAPANPATAMMPEGVGRFVEVNGTITWISDNLAAYVKDGYSVNDIVFAAVNLVMDKVRVAPWSLYKIVDESSLKRYHAIINNKHDAVDWAEARRLRKKALEPITKYDSRTAKIAELLKWANDRTSFSDLVADGVGYQMITGNEYLWANLLDAGANKGLPQELFNLPAQYINIVATRAWPQRITGYQMTNGSLEKFTKEQVMHLKDFNPEYGVAGEGLYGMSALKPGNRTITRNNSAKKAGATQLDNNGAPGIAYVDDPVVPPTGREAQANLMKRAWAKEHSGADQYGKVAFSGYKMGYVSVGLALKDMDLTSIEATDLRGIFNLWGLPSQLGNDPENKSFNNAKEAEKALTTRAAIPRMTRFRDNFNRKIEGDWGGLKGYCVDFDLDVYPELQENQAEKWGWVKDLPVPEVYKLELMNLDIPDELPKDLILVPNNRVPLADLTGTISDEEANDINEELNKSGLNDYR